MKFVKELYPHLENPLPELQSSFDYIKKEARNLFDQPLIELDTLRALDQSPIEQNALRVVDQPRIEQNALRVLDQPRIELDTLRALDQSRIEQNTLQGFEQPLIELDTFRGLEQSRIELDTLRGLEQSRIELDTFRGLEQSRIELDTFRDLEKRNADICEELNLVNVNSQKFRLNASREFEQATREAEKLRANTIRLFDSLSRLPRSHATDSSTQAAENSETDLIHNSSADSKIFIVQKDDPNVKKALEKMGWLQKHILLCIYRDIQQTDEKIIRWRPAKYIRAEKITQSMRASWSKSKKKLLDRQLIDVIFDKNCLYQANTRNTINYVSLTHLGEQAAIWLINFESFPVF